METFFNHTCHRCGGVDEAKFETSGPHVKQVCLHCGAYVKFMPKQNIPSLPQIRLKIWQVANEDKSIIQSAKDKTGFRELPQDAECYDKEFPRGLLESLMWWDIYLTVRSLVPSTE